jgi:TonB family protein
MTAQATRKSRLTAVFAFLLIAAAAGIPSAFAQSRQLSLADILIALRSKKAELPEKNKILANAVKERGVTFAMTPDIEKELGSTGAQKDLIDAIKSRTPAPAKVEPAVPVVVPVKAVVPPPPDFDFYRARASAALQKNELDTAIAELTKALELKPAAASAYLDRGLILAQQGKNDAAVVDFDKAIQFEPSVAAFNARAAVREKLGNADGAMGDYRRAIDLDGANEIANTAFNRLMAAKVDAEAKLKEQAAKQNPPPANVSAATSAQPAGSRIVSVGPLNGQATRLASPTYTAEHRRMGLQGKVTVFVSLDEKGEILSAEATDGPKQLRIAAEDAVKKSKFKPYVSQGQAVKSSGFITFNFVAN